MLEARGHGHSFAAIIAKAIYAAKMAIPVDGDVNFSAPELLSGTSDLCQFFDRVMAALLHPDLDAHKDELLVDLKQSTQQNSFSKPLAVEWGSARDTKIEYKQDLLPPFKPGLEYVGLL